MTDERSSLFILRWIARCRWFEFNDQNVREFNVANMSDECYGGASSVWGKHKQWETSDQGEDEPVRLLERWEGSD